MAGMYATGPGLNQYGQQTLPPGATTDPTNPMAPTAIAGGTNAGLALKALQDASGLNLLGSYNSTTGGIGGGTGSGISGYGTGYGSAPSIAPLQAPDMTAANKAAFNSAKDTVGQTNASALSGLRDSLAGRGMLGSGLEARGTEQLAEAGQGQLGDVSRQQAQTNAELAQQTAEENYQGSLAQRGQDIGQATAYRGQDTQLLAAQQARQAQLMQGLLGAMSGQGLY